MRLPGSLLMAACLATSLPACGASRAPSSLAQHAAGAPPAKGISNVRLIVEPRDGVRPVVRDINLAQTKIFVAVYILTDRSVVHALDRAAAQGVDVYVLLEHHPFGMGSQPGAMAASLRAAGIHVRWSDEGFTYAHAKYLILDDREALIGTANLSASAFSHNREFVAVAVRTPDVRAVSNLFRSDWDRLPAVINDPELVAAPGQARAQIEGLAASARRTIDIYAEEVADPGMERELISIARRGVQIRVLLPPGAVSVGARILTNGGVRVRTLASPYVHAKALLVDGREGFVGSENISTTSLDHNRELGVLVRGKPLRDISSFFGRDWQNAAPFH